LAYKWPRALFGLGIVSALLGTFFGWKNLQTASRYFRDRADGGHPASHALDVQAKRFMRASIGSLLASGGCLIFGAVVLWCRFTS
jgi:hypothetical protein